MTCTSCQKMNLPGGVRCIYCGTPFPVAPEFDMGAGAAAAPVETAKPVGATGFAAWRQRGLLGSLAVLALKAKTLFALLKFGKIATTLFSMLAFIAADAALFGWKFGVGIAVCILIHEMGHVVVNWRKGLKQTAPMFIPFIGAVIFIKQFPNDPTIEAESGAGGPAAGLLAALGCLLIGTLTHNPYWIALANVGFAINLFNLLPFPPLDGSHISAVFTPKVWDVVLITMLLWVIKMPSPMLWLILLVGFIFRLGRTQEGRHQLATSAARLRMAALYVFLCLGLAYGVQSTTRTSNRSDLGLPGAARNQPASVHSAAKPGRATLPAVADSDDETDQDDTPSLAENRSAFTWIARAIVFSVAIVLWTVTAVLLTVTAGRSFRPRNLVLVAVMVGALAVLLSFFHLTTIFAADRGRLLGAYFAATLAAVIYTGYCAVHAQNAKTRPTFFSLIGRCFAWMAGAALVVAYAMNSLPVVVFVLLGALLFYARYPWMLFSLAGRLAQEMNMIERSLEFRRRAIALRPDPESAVVLWQTIAQLQAALSCGEGVLEALRAKEAVAQSVPTSPRPGTNVVNELKTRATGLTLLGRFDEALACCEQILQIADAASPATRLTVVHAQLANIARYRGWQDEALAQADWCLRADANQSKLRAQAQCIRGSALAAMGKTEEAAAACETAEKESKEMTVETWAATVRAQIALLQSDPAGAERETARAMRLLPGNLTIRYWRGRALVAIGRQQEGEALLRELMERHPTEIVSKRIREDYMASSPSRPAASSPFPADVPVG